MLTFNDIFGQERAIESLRRAYLSDCLPHGLIFAGPAGVGKATAARALGAVFLCEKPREDLACGKCASCRVFEAGNHPDYHVIVKEMVRAYDKTGESKATDLSINVIRPELIEAAGRKAAMSRGKVFVIEQAELMSSAAQNASLKTLEEPQGRTIIILLATQAGALLPTIRSRCQIIRFVPLERDVVQRELEKRRISKSDAADAADLTDGSLGVAMWWLEDGVIARARELRDKMERLLSGQVRGDLPEWFKKASDEYAEKQLVRDPLGSKSQFTRDGLAIYFHLAAEMLRGRLAETDDAEQLERLCAGIDALARGETFLDANVTASLIFQQIAATFERLFTTVGASAR
jgi:DNA polymerase-3 subunit delta'